MFNLKENSISEPIIKDDTASIFKVYSKSKGLSTKFDKIKDSLIERMKKEHEIENPKKLGKEILSSEKVEVLLEIKDIAQEFQNES